MSFTTHSTTFSSNYQSLGSVQTSSYSVTASSAASVYACARGWGSWISVSHSTSFQGGWGCGGLATGMAGGLAGIGGIQTEKETMQELNNHLASYLDRVRNLETDNRRLESKIREHVEKKGLQVRDWAHYFKTIEDLRAQIFANTVDNARHAADDFRVKYETELAIYQSVESDIHGFCKVIDDTDITRLQLESEMEALKEELLFMRKNQEEEVKVLQAQIASGLTVEVDAPKSQNLSKIMADMRAQCDELAWKNQEELAKTWSQQIQESTSGVTSQFSEVGAAKTMLTELTRTILGNRTRLHEKSEVQVEAHYAMQMEQLNGVLLHLESELAQTRADGQCQAQEYEALLNIKVKLEAEIATYRRLLEDEENFNRGDALDSGNSVQTIQKTTTCRIVDGKVVSETNNTKVLRH
uniref:IF rod domain-containing protein n=1 Tax=Otolemur garnettii TaxID=30611 RepID=H0XSA0_OTOGA